MALSQEQIDRFHSDGLLIVESGIPTEVLDGILADLDSRLPEKQHGEYHRDGRLQDAWHHSEHVRAAAIHRPVLDALRQLYGAVPRPFQTLNFPRGTEQRPHSDSIHFNSEPFGMMCGVWVALEDIGPDQGPLVYYPGSHKLAEINFEDAGLDPDYALYRQYEDFIEATIAKHGFQPSYAVVKKGQAVIWAANVLHGGSKQHDKGLTRKSQVTHYYFEGGRYWRPGASKRIRYYFEPDWIPHEDSVGRNPVKHLAMRARNAINKL